MSVGEDSLCLQEAVGVAEVKEVKDPIGQHTHRLSGAPQCLLVGNGYLSPPRQGKLTSEGGRSSVPVQNTVKTGLQKKKKCHQLMSTRTYPFAPPFTICPFIHTRG